MVGITKVLQAAASRSLWIYPSKYLRIYPKNHVKKWDNDIACHYSHLFNKRGGWNKRGGGAKVAKSLNVEVGINVEGGIFWKKLVNNSNK